MSRVWRRFTESGGRRCVFQRYDPVDWTTAERDDSKVRIEDRRHVMTSGSRPAAAARSHFERVMCKE
jgi:hypothetical protein